MKCCAPSTPSWDRFSTPDDFYIAFQEGDEIRFELEVEDGQTLPKRSRKLENAFTEYVIRTGQPLLIRSDLENADATWASPTGPSIRPSA